MKGTQCYVENAQAVYREEVREKSMIAKSAHHMGSRSSGAFKHERSKEEIRKMEGPTKTYNLNAPMTYVDFKAMPKDLQAQYIQGIIAKYKVGPAAIAKFFGISSATGTTLLQQLEIKIKGYSTKQLADYFLEDFAGRAAQPADTPQETPTPSIASTSTLTPVLVNVDMQEVDMAFTMDFCALTIAERLDGLFPQGQRVRVNIQIETVG